MVNWSAAGGELLDVEVIPQQEHWDEGFALGNSHFPSVFLQWNLFIWKKCLTETKGKNIAGGSGPRLENTLGDGGNVFDDSESTH